ncbi:sigma-70 family RNA polymerase sigma factor [Spiractinospora alimapuensis]|uniref:RNA polymerase sigma factor n=1 Tax=Spiractinospora alimapuensis TaxID=2820884 RepID=UPI001F37B16E|nr:sigma-70 family RNA polymerase sigma factor [Spiractinospora alimapuensis]QVQ53529.1 sigma-70 family RNA polymerase sigma factor [Spiractinospora alimapuensis]
MGNTGDVSGLVNAASTGRDAAWRELTRRFGGLIWTMARAEGLNAHDASDVEQTVWLRLVEHIDHLREPDSVRAWLLTTARHECRRLRLANRRVRPVAEPAQDGWVRAADEEAHERERTRLVLRVLRRLPVPCGLLLRLQAHDPVPEPETLAAVTGVPVGDLPKARRRCLRSFRRRLDALSRSPRGRTTP